MVPCLALSSFPPKGRWNAGFYGINFRSHWYDNLKSLTVYGLSNDTVASAAVAERQMKGGELETGKTENEGQNLFWHI
jgi:hypothetical protein